MSTHQKLAQLTGGLPLTPLTVDARPRPHHAASARRLQHGHVGGDRVVDYKGEVFGHPGLFVADGAIVPKAIGLNPSRTIAALAEYIAADLVPRL